MSARYYRGWQRDEPITCTCRGSMCVLFTLAFTILIFSGHLSYMTIESEPWYPSEKDEISVEVANGRFQHWMVTIISWASSDAARHRHIWDDPIRRQLFVERPKHLQIAKDGWEHAPCGQLQDKMDAWVNSLQAAGYQLPQDILSEKPDLCSMAPIRQSRRAGSRTYTYRDSEGILTAFIMTPLFFAAASLSYWMVYHSPALVYHVLCRRCSKPHTA